MLQTLSWAFSIFAHVLPKVALGSLRLSNPILCVTFFYPTSSNPEVVNDLALTTRHPALHRKPQISESVDAKMIMHPNLQLSIVKLQPALIPVTFSLDFPKLSVRTRPAVQQFLQRRRALRSAQLQVIRRINSLVEGMFAKHLKNTGL